jgi:hypothetical protein
LPSDADSKAYVTSFRAGEAPFYRQATFSVWKDLDDVKAFAYQSEEHKEVIQKARDEIGIMKNYLPDLNRSLALEH